MYVPVLPPRQPDSWRRGFIPSPSHGILAMPADGLPATLEHFAAFVDDHQDVMRQLGFKPHFLRSGLLHAAAGYREAVRRGSREAIAAAEAEANRVLKATVEALVAGVSAGLRQLPRRMH